MNLSTAKSVNRASEIAMTIELGAERRRIGSSASVRRRTASKLSFVTMRLRIMRIARDKSGQITDIGKPDVIGGQTDERVGRLLELRVGDVLDVQQLEKVQTQRADRQPQAIQQLYGLDDQATQSFGTQCLMARRLVERGVRMVQVYFDRAAWDSHLDILAHRPQARVADQPIAALIADLNVGNADFRFVRSALRPEEGRLTATCPGPRSGQAESSLSSDTTPRWRTRLRWYISPSARSRAASVDGAGWP